jgi:prefoldin subunit 5
MVAITDVVLAPVKAGRLALRAADDLNAIAQRARRDPDPVEEVRERLDALLGEIGMLTAQIGPLHAAVTMLIAAAERVDGTAGEIVAGGRDLTAVARILDGHAVALIDGGDRLRRTSESLDTHSVELIDGGADLTAVAQDLAGTLRVFRAVLPRLLEGLDTVEQLEGAVETVAETVEPLAGAAEGVGRITDKLTRRSKS